MNVCYVLINGIHKYVCRAPVIRQDYIHYRMAFYTSIQLRDESIFFKD